MGTAARRYGVKKKVQQRPDNLLVPGILFVAALVAIFLWAYPQNPAVN